MRRTTFYGAFLVLLSLMIVSCEKTKQKPNAKTYKTEKVILSNASVQNSYSVSIRGEQFVDIRSQISGVITQILINEGASIKKNQPLFIIDQVPYKAALEIASANVKSAKSKVESARLDAEGDKELFAQKVISKTQMQKSLNILSSAQADLSLAQAQEINARNNLSYTVIKSPVDGVASMITYRVGALVNSNITQPLVSVTSNKKMYAYFSMSESQVLSLSQSVSSDNGNILKNMPQVELILNNGTIYNHKGVIDAISGIIDKSTGSISMRAIFDNPNLMLRDGGNGSIILRTEKRGVIVIPKLATFEIQNKIFVYRIVDDKATSQEIKVYPFDNGKDYIVESGLKVGDVIVSEGAGLIREGTYIDKNGKGMPEISKGDNNKK